MKLIKIALLVLAFVFILFKYTSIGAILVSKSNGQFTATTLSTLHIGNNKVQIETAETDDERNQGLSGRSSLKEGSGMLFVFDHAAKYGFWMKDMNFAIDLVWIDENKMILGCEKNATPGSYPTVFYPPGPAQYVLEVPAHFCDTREVKTGEMVSWTY